MTGLIRETNGWRRTMTLNKELEELYEGLQILVNGIVSIQKRVRDAREAWPDHQVRENVSWHSRSETPPDEQIWASDGVRVWLIHGKGEPIPPAATAVKYWTTACIPAPPVEENDE